jgi:hypothetical protein
MKNKLSKLFSYLPIMYSVMLRSYRNRILKLIFRGGVSVEDYAREMAGKLPDDVWRRYLETKIGMNRYFNKEGNLCGSPKFDRKKAIAVFQSHEPNLRFY